VSYEGPFRPSGVLIDEGGGFICEAHDFDPDPALVDIAQRIDVSRVFSARFSFQWDQPFFSVSGPPGAASDLDILLFNVDGTRVVPFSGGLTINTGRDPVEVLSADLPTQLAVDLVITRCDGPGPQLMKYVQFGGPAVIDEFATASGTIYGHTNARGAEAVGAADYRRTPAFGFTPPVVEDFSSAGGVAIRLNTAGQALVTPEVRTKPGIVAPDGVNTTSFTVDRDDDNDTFPNFFGTSAAAPHAAAIAALVLEKNGSLSPDAVYARLRSNAIDMDDPSTPAFDTGFDFRTGFGLVDAVGAFPLSERRTCQGRPATIAGSGRRRQPWSGQKARTSSSGWAGTTRSPVSEAMTSYAAEQERTSCWVVREETGYWGSPAETGCSAIAATTYSWAALAATSSTVARRGCPHRRTGARFLRAGRAPQGLRGGTRNFTSFRPSSPASSGISLSYIVQPPKQLRRRGSPSDLIK
jgi:subtilase family protein